ncbi:RagB/SusD family nutrient uptake outer membrane protein [Agriterribacter sp.]|uniref:RagB/SusD family nutrient uptake outer membrane protein n=1 Tax=Agriterribacter sp. TaxID=2821509 RepID=UPI002C1AAE99|nr:RagB/SusD family nutrient uptake outer membrane protein [Agriterribacter sp.]HRP54457.1 RagB/SusD family nutrient uptake outer membrane protein [Agriterribacter sp.]
MKITIRIFLIFFIINASCKKGVLDKVPLDMISDDVVWKDPALINAYLTECYAGTYVFTNVSTDNSWDNLWKGDAGPAPMWINEVSDESRTAWLSDAYPYKSGNLKINGGLLEWWENAYKVIRKLNQFIQTVPESPLEADLKKVRIAEARFLRAYNYFEMVKRYGGIPLITEVQDLNSPQDILYPKRAKEQEIYDFVLSEVNGFSNDLPETSNDLGRPTKYAALALKCRAALYAGSIAQFGTVQLDGVVGIDASAANTYYQEAYNAAEQIINSHVYSLYKKYPDDKVVNFRNIFLEKNNAEQILVKRHDENNGMGNTGNGWGYDFFQCPLPNGWGSGNQNAVYLEMAEEFEYIDGRSGTLDRNVIQQGLWTTEQLWGDKDPRFFATIYTQNTTWQGSILDYHKGILKPDGTIQTDGSYNGILANGVQNKTTGFGVMKYLDESHGNLIGSNGDWATSSTDFIVFRLGEILLNYAEAALYLGKSDDALDAVNQIRERAGIATLASVDQDKIRHERKVELAFEGHRYWDLRRWRTAVTDLSRNFSGLQYILDYTTGKYKLLIIENVDGTVAPPAFYPQNYYLPITLTRTGNNPNLVENPGYQ